MSPLLTLLWSAALAGEAPDPCAAACGADPVCLQAQVACLVAQGEARAAVERCKDARAEHPDDPDLGMLLAWAYLESGNRVWASRTLLALVDAHPDDARARAWATWVVLEDGDLARARQLLDGAPAQPPGAEAGRLALLRATLGRLQEQPEAALAAVEEASRAPGLLAEDRPMLASLRRDLLGDRGEPWSLRLEASGGGTTNAIESAPQDAGSGAAGVRAPASPVAALDAVMRYEPWSGPRLRPLAEARLKGFAPLTDDAEGFGYLSGGVRFGGEAGPADGRRLRLLYSGELMGLRGDADEDELEAGMSEVEGGLLMEAHRGELELDLSERVQLFAGSGRRVYRDLVRTRWEWDGGGALVLPLGGGWNLTGVAAGRYQLARHPAWSSWGLTGLARLRVPLPGDWMVLTRAMVLWDDWPRFGEYEPSVEERHDLAFKAEIGPWTRDFDGWRFGLDYAFSHRASSMESYDYTDHRVLLEARWQRAWNPGLPRAVQPPGLDLPWDWGLDAGGDQGLDRVQDLLRQEDSARRGSSCAD
ncbi:MAG: tetratricopeptide repeat protein [Pseudomonadota bacterium]